jgi:VanZ family protein
LAGQFQVKTTHLPTAIAGAFWLACLGVATLSLMPVDKLPAITLDLWDKAQHAAGFFLLCALGLWAYPKHLVRVCIGLLLFGVAIEVAQSASGWRTGDPLDWVADSLGVALAALAMRNVALANR